MAQRLLRTPARLGLSLLLLAGHNAAKGETPGSGPAIGAAAAMQPALLDVSVNGQRGDAPESFLRDGDGRLLIGAATLRAWRIRVPASGAVTYQGEAYYPASALPALRITVAEAEQSVAIDADPGAFETQSAALGAGEQMAMTAPAFGAYVNYDLFVEHVRGETQGAGAFEAGLFTSHGVGFTTFIASAGGGQARVTRLETTWTIDRPDHLSSIRIGDSVSAAGPGAAPVRFAGIQFARNFAVQPGYLTMPLPVASGSAAVPSVVDVYVNNVLQGQQQVAPGPFELSNVPVPSGNGTVQIVVRDLLGREIVSEQNYYASTLLLRRGLHDFSYEAGFLRRRFGIESNRYGAFFVSTTHRYGFTDRLTGEATAQVSEHRQMAGATVTAIAFDVAQVAFSASASHTERGSGYRAAAAIERRTSGLSFCLLSEYASRDYATLGLARIVPPHLMVQGFANLGLRWGGIGANLVYRDLRGALPDETLASTFVSWRVAPRMSLQLYARRSVIGRSQTDFGAHLAIALDGRRSASASFDQSRGGSAGYISYQDDPPPGPGDGFRATARIGEQGGAEAAYVRNFSSASVSAQASYARGAGAVRLTAGGGLGWIDGRAFASRRLGPLGPRRPLRRAGRARSAAGRAARGRQSPSPRRRSADRGERGQGRRRYRRRGLFAVSPSRALAASGELAGRRLRADRARPRRRRPAAPSRRPDLPLGRRLCGALISACSRPLSGWSLRRTRRARHARSAARASPSAPTTREARRPTTAAARSRPTVTLPTTRRTSKSAPACTAPSPRAG